jgi:drug/metabolite transporter (DMT)-like permease
MLLSRFWTGVFLVILAGVCYGFTPIFATYAYQGGATACVHLLLRFSVAAVCFFLYIAVLKRNCIRMVGRIVVFSLLAAGILEFAASYLYVASVQYISAGFAGLLFYTYLIWVAVWNFLFKKERLKLSGLAGIALAMIGLAMVVGVTFGKISAGGVIMALVAALACSGFIMFSNKALEMIEPVFTSACVCFLSAVIFYLLGSSTGTITLQISSVAWLASIGSALITCNIAMFAFMEGMKRVGSTTASVLCTVEPVSAVVFSALLLSQKLTGLQLLGGLVILMGAVLVVTSKRQPDEGG